MKIRMYYLADIFTLTETLLAVVLFVMAIVSASPDHAFWVFVAGELCDAVDGPCARHWHYPKDGKYRWWRHYNSEIDQISDIMLAVSCGIYLIWRVDFIIGSVLLFGIGAFCLGAQFTLYRFDKISRRFVPKHDIPRDVWKTGILFRRFIYVFFGVGGAIATMFYYASWSWQTKAVLLAIGLAATYALVRLKRNRLTQDRTPL